MNAQFSDRLYDIARQKPEGFTFNPLTNTFPTKGYVVAASATQDCFGKQGLYRIIKYCLNHAGYCIGGWKNEMGTMQFDASRVFFDIKDAIQAAIENGQRAIFDLYRGVEIMACDYSLFQSGTFAA